MVVIEVVTDNEADESRMRNGILANISDSSLAPKQNE